MKLSESLFIDYFNPKDLNAFMLPKRIKDELAKGVHNHFIFHGTSGLGKSSLAKYLASKHPNLYINVGQDGTIDTLRTRISKFCEEIPMNFDDYESDMKVVILDEIGQKSSTQFYEGLKGLMDTYSKNVRFIATTNYFQLVPDSLKSRFDCINFGFESSAEKDARMGQYKKYMKAIITALKCEITEDALDLLVDINFPDYRGGLQTLQKIYKREIKSIDQNVLTTANYDFIDLYELLLSGDISRPEAIHELLMGQYANSAMEVLDSLNNNFVSYITKTKNQYCAFIPDIIVTTAKYSDMAGRIDPALAMKACCFTILRYINTSKNQ